jgi:hypothetical protein
MKHTILTVMLLTALCLVSSLACAGTTWYANGVSGSDSHNCLSSATACKTIGHAVSLSLSGDTIIVAAATYKENLKISKSLNILGSSASTTIVDGGRVGTVVTISSTNAHVSLSRMTIRNGFGSSGNGFGGGGGIVNMGTMTIDKSTISSNNARGMPGQGGGLLNRGTLTVNNSVFMRNGVSGVFGAGFGGAIFNYGTVRINNTTISGNTASGSGGGINNAGNLALNNTTISGNSSTYGANGSGGLVNSAQAILQNTIIANNSRGNCNGTITSHGYNLSSDDTCNFDGPGDMNNTNPVLGSLQNNGGPTFTQALLSGSPAIDAGNPSGCTDDQGHLLKTDQRGEPRPDTEDIGGCDMGAFEHQTD